MTSARGPPGSPRGPGWPPMVRRASFRRFRRHPPPGLARLNRGLQGPHRFLELRGFRDRRGLRQPRTSGRRGPARLVRRHPGPPGRARSARQARPPRGLRAATATGPQHRGPPDLGRPARARPGPRDQEDPARRARVPRVPVRGRAITRSARPRPGWDRRLRPGLRAPPPASRLTPAARGSRRAARAVLGALAALVREDAGPVGPASRTDRVRAGSRVHVPVVPGRAR